MSDGRQAEPTYYLAYIWIADADTDTAAMEDASRSSPDRTQRLPEKHELTPQRKDIYEFLKQNKAQKAHAIAKAVGNRRRSDVNRDLYEMQTLKLLDCSEDKLWSIKAEGSSPEKKAENNAKMEHSNKNGRTATNTLSDEQREIFTFLEGKQPMRAIDIAKGVGKCRACEVNSNLYAMKNMDLLAHSDKLWSHNDTRCTKSIDECDAASSSSTLLSDNNCTSLKLTYVESPDSQPCDSAPCNNDTGEDTGTAPVDHKITGGPRVTQALSTVPSFYNASHPPIVQNNFYNTFYNSQVSSIGHNCIVHSEFGHDFGYMAGESTAPDDAVTAQDGQQQTLQPEWSDATQNESGPPDASNISATEEIQGRTPQNPSAPTVIDPLRQNPSISAICNGIEKVNLGE